jgi:hypothetical protein
MINPNPALLLLMASGTYFLVMLIFAAIFAGGLYLAWRGSGENQIDQGRRSFLGGRGARDDHALFFGIQLVIQIFGSDQLRARIHRLIEAEDGTDSADEKRRFMKSVASMLIENQYAWEYGFWEFSADAEYAIKSFNQWRNEIEASMATEPEEMGEIDRLHRFSDQKEYLIVSLLMLIDNSDEPVSDDVGDYRFRPTYSQLALPFRQLCEGFDESDYWRAETFESLLNGIRALDPRAIERDGIYVYPGTEQDGLSSFDLLSEEGWKYLTDHSFRLS